MNTLAPSPAQQASEWMSVACPDARSGMPQPLFLAVSRLTPLVNVDLLITDPGGRLLMTWRADDFYGPGWHVPGGIVRFKEPAARRIAEVARSELSVEVQAAFEPWRVLELTSIERDVRGHFITLAYPCRLLTDLPEDRRALETKPQPGQWAWFAHLPDQTIRQHRVYESWFTRHSPCKEF
jgi:ADP-ribose pyrophosphatase YjhB (NUDIX family)